MLRPITLLLMCLLLPTSAFAISFEVYTDRAAFDAAAGPYTLLTLDEPDSFSFVSDYSSFNDGICAPGLCSYGGNLLHAAVPDYNCGCGIYGSLNTSNMTEIATARLVTAFGFDVFIGSQDEPTFMEFDGFPRVQANGLSFFGVIGSAPFSMGLRTYTYPVGIDNVAMRLATVPESSSFWILGLSLAWLIGWRPSFKPHIAQ